MVQNEDITARLAKHPFREKHFTAARMEAVEQEIREGTLAEKAGRKRHSRQFRWLGAAACAAALFGAIVLYRAFETPRTTAPISSVNMQHFVADDSYALDMPEDWTATKMTDDGQRWTFDRNGKSVGGVNLIDEESETILDIDPAFTVASEQWDVGGITARVDVVRMTFVEGGTGGSQMNQLIYYIQLPESLPSYEVYFNTDNVDEDTASQVAHSFRPVLEPSVSPLPPTEPPSPPPSGESQAQQIWADIDTGSDILPQYPRSETLDQLTYEQTLEGLQHNSAPVRWYAAHRIVEFDNAERHSAIVDELTKALDDNTEYVANIARFSLDVLQGEFRDRERFIPSPDGTAYGFTKYREAKWNDGSIWLAKQGEPPMRIYSAEIGGILDFDWSPNSQWVIADVGVQVARWIALIDLRTGLTNDRLDLVNRIIDDAANGYVVDREKAARLDPYESFVEWSPDSSKFLFMYSFADENFIPYGGYGVYNIAADKIEQVFASPANESVTRPENFKWD